MKKRLQTVKLFRYNCFNIYLPLLFRGALIIYIARALLWVVEGKILVGI